MKSKLYYKIVRKIDDELWSYTGKFPGNIVYKEGKKNLPKEDCGPLAVFNELVDALTFLEKDYVYKENEIVIYSCTIEESPRKYLFQVGDLPNMVPNKYFPLPAKTVFADSVTLLSIVGRTVGGILEINYSCN